MDNDAISRALAAHPRPMSTLKVDGQHHVFDASGKLFATTFVMGDKAALIVAAVNSYDPHKHQERGNRVNGKITISRWHGNQEPRDGITIEVTDETSGIRFLEVGMTLEAFAQAVTGLSHQPCEIELRGIENVGKVRELKTEVVPFNYSSDKPAALAPFEVDGWKGYAGDLGNPHKVADGGYRVSFTRYVDAPKG